METVSVPRYGKKLFVNNGNVSSMGLEYILRQTNKEEFSINCKDYEKILRPSSVESTWIPGTFKLTTPVGSIEFSPEPPGLQVSFEDYSGSGTYEEYQAYANKSCQEILESLEAHTGEKGEIVELGDNDDLPNQVKD